MYIVTTKLSIQYKDKTNPKEYLDKNKQKSQINANQTFCLMQLAIEVKDGGTPSLTAADDVIVTLQVTGVNDKDPEFSALPYTTTLAENLNFNNFVYGPVALDLDVIDDSSTLQPYTCSIVCKYIQYMELVDFTFSIQPHAYSIVI